MRSLVPGSSQSVTILLGRATVAWTVWMIGRQRWGRGGTSEGGVRVSQADVEAHVNMSLGGCEVQGGSAPHAPHCHELPQGGREEVHGCF